METEAIRYLSVRKPVSELQRLIHMSDSYEIL